MKSKRHKACSIHFQDILDIDSYNSGQISSGSISQGQNENISWSPVRRQSHTQAYALLFIRRWAISYIIIHT